MGTLAISLENRIKMNDCFKIGMKVFLNDEFGVVIKSDYELENDYGLIRWDTSKEIDVEDWRGLFGTFITMGGKILCENHNFEYINDDGSLKNKS